MFRRSHMMAMNTHNTKRDKFVKRSRVTVEVEWFVNRKNAEGDRK